MKISSVVSSVAVLGQAVTTVAVAVPEPEAAVAHQSWQSTHEARDEQPEDLWKRKGGGGGGGRGGGGGGGGSSGGGSSGGGSSGGGSSSGGSGGGSGSSGSS